MLPNDVLVYMCSFLDTTDIARLGITVYLPDESWTASIRRRCGIGWPGGRAGVAKMYEAVHGFPNCINTGGMQISHCADAVCAVTSTAIEVWGSSGYRRCARDCGVVHCMALLQEGVVAIGGGNGLVIYTIDGPCTHAWYAPADTVISIAAIAGGDEIVFSTVQGRAYAYTRSNNSVRPLYPKMAILCVSAVGGRYPLLVGTTSGTYPARSIPVPCTLIRYSGVIVCAWHTNGHIVTFDKCTLRKLHMFDTGPSVPCVMSVIGDLVCIRHTVWRNGQKYSQYPSFPRVASDNGQHAVTGFT